ncbi:MAG: porin [Alphaproteobacteria bacterium]|nr:porin [Alphaproteobacteria bacterium]
MKKLLLGTTALVSAGFVAQNAQAADPIELSIGGYHNWAFFFADNDSNPATGTLPAEPGFGLGDHDLKFSGEVQLRGSTVLDNGLEVGVRIEIEGETQGDQMDENYAWIEGSFGTFRFGNDDPASAQMATAAPYLNYVFGANSATVFVNGMSQYFARSGAANNTLRSRFSAGAYATFATFPNQSFDDAQLIYFSPVFNGFQFGVSYAPNNTEALPAATYLLPVKAGTASTSPAFTHGQVYSVAGRYDGSVGDVGVTVAAGWMRMEDKAVNNAPLASTSSEAVDVGLVLYFGNWGVGGSYLSTDDWHNVAGTDTEAYDLGIAYWSDGAWSAGVYWLHQEIDYTAGNLVAGANITDEIDQYRLMGQYDLGPGVSVTGALGFDQFDDGVINRTYDTTMVGVGMMIGF